MQRSGRHLGGDDTRSAIRAGRVLYFNPCLGIPPMLLASPRKFFGIHACAGVLASMGLLLFEILR